jgi:tetratricopeptide (TPR) repeat protein
MSDRWQVTRLDNVAGYGSEGQPHWFQVRMQFGIEAFGTNAWRASEAGQRLISDHDEGAEGHEELYLVLSGRATFTVDGSEVDAPAGTLVFVRDPKLRRAARAEEAGTTVMVVGGTPGKGFTPSPWEADADGLRFFATKEYDKAIAFYEQRHAQTPERPGYLYNLACAESLSGRHQEALAHIAQAIELGPDFLASAQEDPDLEAIRSHPSFPRPE